MALDPAAKEETFSARELLERFASEDIEVLVNITIAMVHSNVDDEDHDKPLLKTSITTLHFPSNDDAPMVQLEDDLSLLDVSAKFGIDPDLQVWEVNDVL
jgi:hypothetical protein